MSIDYLPLEVRKLSSRNYHTRRDLLQVVRPSMIFAARIHLYLSSCPEANCYLSVIAAPTLNQVLALIFPNTNAGELLEGSQFLGPLFEVIHTQGVSKISDAIPFRDSEQFQTLHRRCPNVTTIRLRNINPLYALRTTLARLECRCPGLLLADWNTRSMKPVVLSTYFNAVMNHSNTINALIPPPSVGTQAQDDIRMFDHHLLRRLNLTLPAVTNHLLQYMTINITQLLYFKLDIGSVPNLVEYEQWTNGVHLWDG